MKRSKRFEVLEARPVHEDGFVREWPEVGLVAVNGPNDPKPGIKIENGVVVEMDGIKRSDFDMIDQFIADHAINLRWRRRLPPWIQELAKMIVDINVPRKRS